MQFVADFPDFFGVSLGASAVIKELRFVTCASLRSRAGNCGGTLRAELAGRGDLRFRGSPVASLAMLRKSFCGFIGAGTSRNSALLTKGGSLAPVAAVSHRGMRSSSSSCKVRFSALSFEQMRSVASAAAQS